MNQRSTSVSFLLATLTFAAAACGGGDAAPVEAGSGSGTSASRPASSAVSTVPGSAWAGLWVDEDGTWLVFEDDGRYAKLSTVGSATEDLRLLETGENEYGETTITAVNRKAGWQVEGDQLVSYKRPADPERKDERIAGHTFHRASPEQKLAYWNASAWRLVRNGRMDEILEAEAGGFDFSKIVDSSITQALPGQNVFVDIAAYAREKGQTEIADHFDEKYGPYAE